MTHINVYGASKSTKEQYDNVGNKGAIPKNMKTYTKEGLNDPWEKGGSPRLL